MPFTLAHPAAVLPLRELGLPMSALVAGSMVPDIPQLFGLPRGARDLSHSFVGIFTINLATGMLAVVLWYCVFRSPLADLALDPWRNRLPDPVPLRARTWLLSLPAVIIGASTHVAWDSFTHSNGVVVEHVSALRASIAGVRVYDVLQYFFSILGIAIVLVFVSRRLARLPDRPQKPAPLVGRWALISVLAWAALSGMLISALVAPYGAEAAVYYMAVTPVLALGLGLTCLCVWWQLTRMLRALRRS